MGEIGEFIGGESECWGLPSHSCMMCSCGVVVAVMGTEASSTVMTVCMSTVCMGSPGGAGVSKMVGVAVTVCGGMVVAA